MGWRIDMLRDIVDWVIRPRSMARYLLRYGTYLMIVCGGGFLISISYQGAVGSLELTLDTSSGPVDLVLLTGFCLGAVMVVSAIVLGLVIEWDQGWRKRVIVVEQRGLRDTTDTPLELAVPWRIIGRRESVLIDIRERTRDGILSDPDTALDRINGVTGAIERIVSGKDRSDIQLVYGGLVPVPFAFLTGMLLDDESKVSAFDWDRNAESWRMVDGTDDGDRFSVSGIDTVNGGEAVAAVSVSYMANLEKIKAAFPALPVIHLQVGNKSVDCHWSAEKQAGLAAGFLDAMKALQERFVRTIHLVIASQNSVAFRLGRSYDKRNLPDATVYQYEASMAPAYPWGVRMPTHGRKVAEIVRL